MNGNDQIIGNKQGTTRPLSGQSLMRASKGVITTSMMKPVMMKVVKLLILMLLMLMKLRCKDEAAAIVWRDCPSTQPELTPMHTNTQVNKYKNTQIHKYMNILIQKIHKYRHSTHAIVQAPSQRCHSLWTSMHTNAQTHKLFHTEVYKNRYRANLN